MIDKGWRIRQPKGGEPNAVVACEPAAGSHPKISIACLQSSESIRLRQPAFLVDRVEIIVKRSPRLARGVHSLSVRGSGAAKEETKAKTKKRGDHREASSD